MQKYRTIWTMTALVVLLTSACYKSIPVEKPILSEDKIKAVLKDVHVAEALLTETSDRRKKDSLARIYYGQILRIHNISPEDFDQSMNAYFTSPGTLDSLYQKIILDISKEKASFSKESPTTID
jgi:hypothetical protein